MIVTNAWLPCICRVLATGYRCGVGLLVLVYVYDTGLTFQRSVICHSSIWHETDACKTLMGWHQSLNHVYHKNPLQTPRKQFWFTWLCQYKGKFIISIAHILFTNVKCITSAIKGETTSWSACISKTNHNNLVVTCIGLVDLVCILVGKRITTSISWITCIYHG